MKTKKIAWYKLSDYAYITVVPFAAMIDVDYEHVVASGVQITVLYHRLYLNFYKNVILRRN